MTAPKPMSAEEKLGKILGMEVLSPRIAGVLHCPYGDPTHYLTADGSPEENCKTCSVLDGSECVDKFIEAWDQWSCLQPEWGRFPERQGRLASTVVAMRAWREARRRVTSTGLALVREYVAACDEHNREPRIGASRRTATFEAMKRWAGVGP